MKGTKERKTKQRGITLIALIITIIVMLILVSVTIAMAVNGGLFDYAGKAVGETKNAIDKEQELADGRVKIGDKWYASIDDYINNNPIQKGITIEKTLKLEIEANYNVETSTPVTGQLTVVLNEIKGTVTWSSDNEAVARVSNTGLITAIAEGTAKITASVTFEGETYSATCNVIVEKQKITSSVVSKDLTTYLGQLVNYTVAYDDISSYGEGKWEIFYADEDHIYIITKGCLSEVELSSINGYSSGSLILKSESSLNKFPALKAGLLDKTYNPASVGSELKYQSMYQNMKGTLYLLDSTVWDDDYAPETNEFADWAIGTPTLELFVKSYNAYYRPENEVIIRNPSGYRL